MSNSIDSEVAGEILAEIKQTAWLSIQNKAMDPTGIHCDGREKQKHRHDIRVIIEKV